MKNFLSDAMDYMAFIFLLIGGLDLIILFVLLVRGFFQ